MSVIVNIDTVAPMPKMHKDVAPFFQKLRVAILERSGIDFLSRCGDVMRSENYTSTKDGVANRSWHKTGRAFDYNQADPNLLIVPEISGGQQYFRTYLKCKPQDGSKGTKMTLNTNNAGKVTLYAVDFTALAMSFGFVRIPAWSGWQTSWNRREFWHYEKRDNLTWDQAMLQLKGKERPADQKVLGLSDRGADVRELQTLLHVKGYLPKHEIDGVFGPKTQAAVKEFQRAKGLDADGLVGPKTRAMLN